MENCESTIHLILNGPHTQPYFLMQQAGFLEKIGKENVMENLNNAILRSRELLKRDLDLPTLIVPS